MVSPARVTASCRPRPLQCVLERRVAIIKLQASVSRPKPTVRDAYRVIDLDGSSRRGIRRFRSPSGRVLVGGRGRPSIACASHATSLRGYRIIAQLYGVAWQIRSFRSDRVKLLGPAR